MESLKIKIYNIIRDDDHNDFISNLFDGMIICLIILNVILVIADTFEMPYWYLKLSSIVETVSIIVFTIEYILRVWTSTLKYPDINSLRSRLRYILSFMAIIDFIAILPFFIPLLIPIDLRVLRAVRILRLLRIFKANRYISALKLIGDVFKRKAGQLFSSFLVVFILMIISSVLMCNIEKNAQPEHFSNALSGLWWAVATITTVGYGDVFPVTAAGKILSGIIAILGIGLVAVPTGIISVGFLESVNDQKTECTQTDHPGYCPYCGKKLHD